MFAVVAHGQQWVSGDLSPCVRIYDPDSRLLADAAEIWAAPGTILDVPESHWWVFETHCVQCDTPELGKSARRVNIPPPRTTAAPPPETRDPAPPVDAGSQQQSSK